MAVRCAHSLNVLLRQIDNRWPNRSKASDGWIGDPAHAARVSDHNPDQYDIVRARDFTNDPDGGLSCQWLANMLVHNRDARIRYLIWNHKIWFPGSGWEAYTGANPHTKHLHLSVVHTPLADSTVQWKLTIMEDNDMDLREPFNATAPVWRDDEHKNTVGGTLAYLVAMGIETQRRITSLAAKVEAMEERENNA
jgi:hypothetical protein